MEFKLNKKEEESLKNLIEALKTIYEVDEITRNYIVSPGPIGCGVDVRLIGLKERVEVFDITRCITDYDSW